LPSAKLTVDEFREIWFQNASDPPSFAKPRTTIEQRGSEAEEERLLLPAAEDEENTAAQEAEAQSAFLEEMVADRALEDEINRHLGNDEFQQALAEMNGTLLSPSPFWVHGANKSALREEHQSKEQQDDGNLSELDDDDEVSGAIITEDSDQFILRAHLWMESNLDYLKEQRGTL